MSIPLLSWAPQSKASLRSVCPTLSPPFDTSLAGLRETLGGLLSLRALRARAIRFGSPEKKDHAAHRLRKGARGGRPPIFDAEAYTGRNVVERCFNRLMQFRGLATRYAKRAAHYRSSVVIAVIVLWLR